jgi:tetratricopeptide (TPR) repeat protein
MNHTLRVQLRWLTIPVVLWSAQVRAEPSRTLERAVALYDKGDYWSASAEFARVDSGDTGDDAEGRERARFYLAKSLFQIGFYVPALTFLDRLIDDNGEHAYREPALKWILSVADKTPGPGPGALMWRYRNRSELADRFGSVRDSFAFELGRELARRDQLADADEWLSSIPSSSKYYTRASLVLERVLFQRKKVRAAIDAGLVAARDPALASDAVRLIVAWTRRLGDPVKGVAALRTIAQTESPAGAIATLELSRLAVEDVGGLPGLPKLAAVPFDAIVLATACKPGGSEDLLTDAMPTIKQVRVEVGKLLQFDDNAELYEAVKTGIRDFGNAPAVSAIRLGLDDMEPRERIAWLLEIQRELDQLHTADRAWQTTEVAAIALQELTVQESVAAADVGAVLRGRLKQLDADLDAIEKVFAQPVTLPAGPSIATGRGFAVTEVACDRARAATPSPAVIASSQNHGCAGCSSGEGGATALFAIALCLFSTRRSGRGTRSTRRHSTPTHHAPSSSPRAASSSR